ncbi:MAG: M1 family metallopeptidase, partial [Bacteroidetes bacterium]|nr:M1 family metallopeptidase [Bacteroidota bacterium]
KQFPLFQPGVVVNIKFIIAAVFLIFRHNGFSQQHTLYTPLEIQRAYTNNTRTPDGRPGADYWQNRSVYRIRVEIDTVNHALLGYEEVSYFNNSPDTMDRIIVRLYQDLFKIGNPRDFDFHRADVGSGMNITHLEVNGETVSRIDDLDRYGTNLFVPLSQKLPPGDTLELAIRWNYAFPAERPVRGGKYPGNAYFVSYWYPQLAVYDDISGWDEYEYKGIVDYYNDFSDYDVAITVPDEFIVWSTGVLQNPQEVLTEKYLSRYEEALLSDEIVSVVGPDDREAGGVTAGNTRNTWHYRADNVPDFAFGTSAHHLWDLTSLVVDRKTQRRAVIGAAYRKDSRQFYNAAEICRKTIGYLSTELPGIPYPFPSFTAFDGSFAMEFPMMTNMKPHDREWLFYHTLSHEISHTYFPFYMGINERKYAFMDEGWAQMLPMAFQTREIGPIHGRYDATVKNNRDYEEGAGTEKFDRPPAALSVNTDFFNYHYVNYDRPGAAYYFLQDLLGEQLFRTALQTFMERWHHKHPTPYDFYNTFNQVAGEDLSWYWKPWFFEFGYPDLAIKELEEESGQRTVVIERKGSIPVPVKLTVRYADGSETSIYETARVWEKGNQTYSVALPLDKRIVSMELGDRVIPDVKRSDNAIRMEF